MFGQNPEAESSYDGGGFLDFGSAPLERNWVSAEYLLWWSKGNEIPPLVSSSPAGTPRADAGVIGSPAPRFFMAATRLMPKIGRDCG